MVHDIFANDKVSNAEKKKYIQSSKKRRIYLFFKFFLYILFISIYLSIYLHTYKYNDKGTLLLHVHYLHLEFSEVLLCELIKYNFI